MEKEYIKPCNAECDFCFLNYTDALASNYLFRGIKPEEAGIIIKKIHHRVKKYRKGDVIACEGERLNDLFIIVKGSVVGEMIDFEGKILQLEKISAPQSIATAFLFGNQPLLPVTITALEETRVMIISRSELLGLFNSNAIILNNFLDIISDRAQFMSRKIKLMSLGTIKGKISYFLLEKIKKSGSEEIILDQTQQEIAEIFGVERPSVGRALREMHNNGCIEAKGKRIKIIDRHKLSALLWSA